MQGKFCIRQEIVNEAIVKFKEKVTYITYNPQKPTKWGFRIYVLTEIVGYVVCIELFTK